MRNRLDLLINLLTSLKIKQLSSSVRFWLPLVSKARSIFILNRFTQITQIPHNICVFTKFKEEMKCIFSRNTTSTFWTVGQVTDKLPPLSVK